MGQAEAVVANTGVSLGFPKHRPIVALAPMAGFTDHCFRLLAKEAGADLVYTELISSQAIHYRNERTFAMMDWTDSERPVAAQIFGADPEIMAEAASMVASKGADLIDVNLGCSVPKVVKTGSGAALLRDLGRLKAVLESVVGASSVPVTVKMRAGWDKSSINAPEVAELAQEVGVCAVAVHGRTAVQGFSGRSDWSIIAAVKRTVSIPVLGNGDIETPEDAARMLEETGCDGVMIGRAAMGNPWIFTRVKAYLLRGEILKEPTPEDRIFMLIRHARMMVAAKGEKIGIHQLRGHAAHYLRHMRHASGLRASFMKANTLAEVEQLLNEALRNIKPLGAAA